MSSLKADAGFVDSDITVIITNLHVRHDCLLMDTVKVLISALAWTYLIDPKRCPERSTRKSPLLKIAFKSVNKYIY